MSFQPTPDMNGGVSVCLLLAGALRPSELISATACSVLDLYLTTRLTVLDAWLKRFEEVVTGSSAKPEVRVLYCDHTPQPRPAAAGEGGLVVTVERDKRQYRGPAGAVKDGCSQYPPSVSILIAEAARYITCDITPMITAHAAGKADITVGCNPDNSPAGLFLVRCGTLSMVPSVGFVDIKEQWLTRAIAAGLNVRTFKLIGRSYELRTREQFLEAARVAAGSAETVNPGLPHEREDGSVIVDSVVMPGATIGPGAVVARSMICPGAIVPAGATVVDEVVGAGVRASAPSSPGRVGGRSR